MGELRKLDDLPLEELEAQRIELLPDREEMTLISVGGGKKVVAQGVAQHGLVNVAALNNIAIGNNIL
jgi:hypothetical protein